jgi:metallo-beta-lactamase class B
MRATLTTLIVIGLHLPLLGGCGAPPPAELLTAGYPEDLCPSCPEWSVPQPPFKIFGNTYYVGTHGLASILITSSDGHVLIDGGLPNSAPLILENISELGFSIADVKLILNSHAHYDHAGGIAALQLASGARVAASQPSAPVLERGNSGPDDPQFGVLFDFHPVSDVEEFAEGEALTLGSLSLTPHITAGHTRGGTTWSWRVCEADECLNLVYADSQTPVSAAGFRFSESDTYPSAVADFERGFDVLEGISCDILITPHPAASSFWERLNSPAGSPVDRDACRRYAESGRQRLARRLAAEATQP